MIAAVTLILLQSCFAAEYRWDGDTRYQTSYSIRSSCTAAVEVQNNEVLVICTVAFSPGRVSMATSSLLFTWSVRVKDTFRIYDTLLTHKCDSSLRLSVQKRSIKWFSQLKAETLFFNN